ncbi:MAG: hypothetical protein H7061_05065 [Bdellovibrionaceae bacterium]|nr:hypothetical protein [Bdellovibrio sp.]
MKNILQNQKKSSKNLIIVVSTLAIFAGCAPKNSVSVDKAGQGITDALGCAKLTSNVYDSMYELLETEKTVPLASDVKDSVQKKLSALKKSSKFDEQKIEKINQIQAELFKSIDLMFADAAKNPNIDWQQQIEKLIEYEMEDQSSTEIVQTNSRLKSSFEQVKTLSAELEVPCQTVDSETKAAKVNASAAKMAKGINMVFATAYQSCRVLDLPPMTSATPNVVGITRTGTHADGVGGKRQVTDLKAVQSTHYYIRGLATESSCLPVKNNPLIYDYGGKPYSSGNTLNFFKNSGSGTSAMGVDCSGFVSSAIAVAGLRYKPGLANKPIFANQGARKFMNAKDSGFTCFDNVTVTPTTSLEPGDILGVKGHVLTVDQLGSDPFSLKDMKSASDCSSINYRNFDIVVAQSSPSKNGIGINKFAARDYLSESGKMKTAFVEMGKAACLAKFQNKSIKPANSEWGFIRHKGTAECIAPRVTMVGETCTQACL